MVIFVSGRREREVLMNISDVTGADARMKLTRVGTETGSQTNKDLRQQSINNIE